MTDILDETEQSRLRRELEHGKQLLRLLEEKRRLLEEGLVVQTDPAKSFALGKMVEDTKEDINAIVTIVASFRAQIQ